MNTKNYTLAALLIALCGCASTWHPVIDPAANTDPIRTAADDSQCQALAHGNTATVADGAMGGLGVGALLGAAMGAAVGAALGDPGGGAAVGASLWGIGGAAEGAGNAAASYRQIYSNCMAGRGHRVLN